jgi:predicted MFS family arabinose efflux permease
VPGRPSAGADPPLRVRVRLLQAAWVTSNLDRFVVGPLLVSMAVTFGATLAEVAAVASWYLLCYGLAQPLWGLCCDRFGRVPTMRGTLAAAAVAGVVAALAPSLLVLVLSRLPEPERASGPTGGLRAVLRVSAARVVLAIALVEGAALPGVLPYLAPALERSGTSTTVAGLAVAVYGVGLLGAARVAKRVSGRTGGAVLIGTGALLLAVGCAGAALSQSVPAIAVTALAAPARARADRG